MATELRAVSLPLPGGQSKDLTVPAEKLRRRFDANTQAEFFSLRDKEWLPCLVRVALGILLFCWSFAERI